MLEIWNQIFDKFFHSWYTFASIAVFVFFLWALFTLYSHRYHSYAKWTPGNPNCDETSCSSGKVAGLIVYLTFSFLWTSQVIGNVALATLAGGPFGAWYYFGPRHLGEMVRLLLSHTVLNTKSLARSPNTQQFLLSAVLQLFHWVQSLLVP